MAGYYISPAARLRVLRLLDGLGTSILKEPEKLKTLLCPVLVHNKAGQERFYELFDRYWEEVSRPWEMPALPERKKPVQSWPVWVWWIVPLAAVLVLAFGIWKLLSVPEIPKPKVFFEHSDRVELGDTIHFENYSENIDSAALRWEIIQPGDSFPELIDSLSFHLDFVVKKAGQTTEREVRLIYFPPAGAPVSHTSGFRIVCNFPPVIDTILAPRETGVDTPIYFIARLADTADVELYWDFGDGTKTKGGSRVVHKFQRSGVFEVQLTANRTGVEGDCEVTKIHAVSVGRDKAVLAAKTLWPDRVEPLVSFSWGTWILLGILGVAMIWLWVKWVMRKPPALPEAGEDLAAAAEQFKAVDKGPYFIPFRPQEGFIRVERELYRLADVLRMRQEGIRKNLDVPASVRRTIADGGFPQLFSRADSVPTEYLFLIDEQAYGSHQSNLYRFFVNFLQRREVLGEVFYFKSQPVRFWNDQHPRGLLPEQLRRLYPYHRLIMLGDAHAMLDAHATVRPRVQPDIAGFFRQWKHRLLLTPMPVVSWTYREGALHGLFAVFPSDMEGIGEAIKFIERGMQEEDLPTFAAWSERLLEGRAEPDVNYRRWRTAAEHQDYLKNHPALYRWVSALAVYPKPDWNITLAIGHALAAADPKIEVNYDNLLIISRIPWLQSGDLPARLRGELLKELNPADERIAREAVQAELQAVASLVQGSHANQEQQVNLAMQNFALAPENPETQRVIRQLQKLHLLTPRHVAEMNLTLERHTGKRSGDNKGYSTGTLRSPSTLMENLQLLWDHTPEPPARPFFTRTFWMAAAATMLYLILFLVAWNFGGTESLAKLAGVKSDPSTDCKETYLAAGFLKKACTADSAVLYNNLGVQIFKNAVNDTTFAGQEKLLNFNNRVVDALINFRRAVSLNPGYELAKSNIGKAHFNIARAFYEDFLESPGPDKLPWAMDAFRKATAFDSVKTDALHGIGLVHFYEENQDSALVYYGELLTLTESLFFDTLQTYPHLQSLLFRNLTTGRRLVTIEVKDAVSNKTLDNVLVTGNNFQGQTGAGGLVKTEMTLGERREFSFVKKGYLNVKQEIGPVTEQTFFSVAMKPAVRNAPALRSSTSVIYFDTGKNILRADARDALDAVSKMLQDNPGWQVELVGHTTADGSSSYNLKLSRQLAQTAGNYLTSRGISPERLVMRGMGETQIVADAVSSPRVDILINKSAITEGSEQKPLPEDRDGDGVPDASDKCPDEVGTLENYGCLPTEVPAPASPPEDPEWQLVRTHFVAEPKLLKNKDFFDVIYIEKEEYRLILNELDKNGKADFTFEKNIGPEKRAVPTAEFPSLSKGEKYDFNLEGELEFRFVYLGQDRRRVNSLTRDVAVYALYVRKIKPTDGGN